MTKAWSLWLHWYGFSPVCILWWIIRFFFCEKLYHTEYINMAFLQFVFLGGNNIMLQPKSIVTMTTLIWIFPSVYFPVINKILFHPKSFITNDHIHTTCSQYVIDVMWQDFFFRCIINKIILLTLRSYFWGVISDLFMKLWALAGNISHVTMLIFLWVYSYWNLLYFHFHIDDLWWTISVLIGSFKYILSGTVFDLLD